MSSDHQNSLKSSLAFQYRQEQVAKQMAGAYSTFGDMLKDDAELSGAEIDTLIALVEQGPLWDGDVPSKSGRNSLLERGYACKIVVRGEDGYQAATYSGRDAYNRLFGGNTMSESMAIRKAKK